MVAAGGLEKREFVRGEKGRERDENEEERNACVRCVEGKASPACITINSFTYFRCACFSA